MQIRGNNVMHEQVTMRLRNNRILWSSMQIASVQQRLLCMPCG